MTEKQAQREADRLGRPAWYATGDGGGWWVRPKRTRLVNACESCGARPTKPVTFTIPGCTGEQVTEDLCADCGAWVVSLEGQDAMLADTVEDAERRAGWDPHP